MSTREELHRLIDEIPDHQTHLAKRLLEALLQEEDIDSEPLTPKDLEDIKEAEAAFALGEFVTLEELERELDQMDAEEDARRD